MVNLAILIGTGYFGNDIFHKIPWMKFIEGNVKLHVASRIDPGVHLSNNLKILMDENEFRDLENTFNDMNQVAENVSFIYNSPYLNKNYKLNEIIELEKWLGISFSYIASFDRRFYNNEKNKDSRNQTELNNYFAGLTEFFKNFYLHNKIDNFINTIEDDAFSVVGYYVAKKMNINIIGIMNGRFPIKGLSFNKDFSDICKWNNGKSIKDIKWQDIYSLYGNNTIASKDTLERSTRNWSLKALPEKLKGIKYIVNYKSYIKNIEKHYPYEKFIYEDIHLLDEIKNYLQGLFRRFFLKKIITDEIFNDKYFFLPLHFMKDAQITFREPLLEQFTLIFNISRSLPEDHYLYVKPHPYFLGTDVYFKDLLKISRLRNVKIINPMVSPSKLIKNSLGVVTINSTAGFEALILGIPVITWGHDFYCKDNYCHVIRDLNDLSRTLLDVIKKGKSHEKITKDFIKNVYNNTIWISDFKYDNIFSLTDEDGQKAANVLNIILNQI